MSASATSRGVPPTAGVGCSRPANASSPASSRVVPVIGVSRCWRWRSGRTTGASATCSVSTIGARLARSMSTTTACSSRSFSLASSAVANLASSAGSPPRGADPAMATVSNDRPLVRTSRSGVAPRKVVPSRVKANVVLSGAVRARWRSAATTSRSVGRAEDDAARQHDLVDPAAPDRAGEQADRPLPIRTIRALLDRPQRAGRARAPSRASRGRPMAGRRPPGRPPPRRRIRVGIADPRRARRSASRRSRRRPRRTSAGRATRPRTAPTGPRGRVVPR